MTTITVLLLAIGHWFPWRLALGRPLGRISSYVYGTAAVFAPLTVMLILQGYMQVATWIAINIAIAGVTVVGCYAIDDWLHSRAVARESLERELALRVGFGQDG